MAHAAPHTGQDTHQAGGEASDDSLELDLLESDDGFDLASTDNVLGPDDGTIEISPADTATGMPPSTPDEPPEATVEFDSEESITLGSDPEVGSPRQSTQTFEADATIDLPAAAAAAASAASAAGGETTEATPGGSASAADPKATTESGPDESGPADIHATTDASLKQIGSKWKNTYSAEAKPSHTIRQGATVTGFRSSLPVKSRSIREREVAGAGRPSLPLQIGATEVPDYELLDIIGEGGMGVVYAAQQSSIARTVAVKMLKPTKKIGEEQRDKFISEAVVTGELDHPNIVPIYDLGANETGALFYSMKRVKGTPWDKAISKKSLDENLNILLRVADAVAFAHARGVVHRDLKPENVMLGDYGEVLVMDWGLARVTPEFANADTIFQADSLGGTPAYMAPEMARGPVDAIDQRSDVYLLGAILYEIIGSKPPHSGRDVMQCLMAAAQNRIDAIEYEGELKSIAMRAMAPDRDDRYQTVKDFQDDIRTYQSHSESLVLTAHAKKNLQEAREAEDYEPFARSVYGFQEALNLWDGNEQARELLAVAQHDYARLAYNRGDYELAASMLDRVHDDHASLLVEINNAQRERDARVRRLRNLKLLAALLGFVIVAGSAVATFIINNARQVAENEREKAIAARDQEAQAREQEQEARIAEAEAREQAEARRQEAEDAQQKEAVAREQEALARQEAEQRRNEAVDARDKEAVARQQEAEQRRIAERAKLAEEYEAYVARIGLAAAKIDENAYDYALELLEDCPQDMRHWEWGRLVHLCQLSTRAFESGGPVDAVAFSPDGARCISGDWDGKATIRDVISGEVIHSFDHGQYVHAVDYSPNGKLVATGGSDRAVRILDAATGELKLTLAGHEDAVLSVKFSPDGTHMLTSGYDNTAVVWDITSGRQVQKLLGHSWWVWTARFSPNGQRIVTVGQDGKAIVWHKAGDPNVDPPFATAGPYRKLTEFPGHEGAIYTAQFSPDGKYIATGGYDKKVLVWDPDNVEPVDIERRLEGLPDQRQPYLELAGHDGPVRAVAFSPNNSRLLLSGSHDNTLRLWDISTGRLVKTLRGHGGRVRSCDFSPDGNWVLSAAHDDFVRLWNIEGYQEVRVLRSRVLKGHTDAVLSARFSPSGKQVVTASRDRTASLWDVNTGARLREFDEGHRFLASSAEFFDGGRRLATGAGDNSVRIWEVATGTELKVLSPTGRMGTLAVSPDARWIVTGTQSNDAQIWNANSGDPVAQLPGHTKEVTVARFTDDGRLLVTGDDHGNLRLWQATGDAGNPFSFVRELVGHSRTITGVRFYDNDRRLITASGDSSCAQWDVASGRELPQLTLRHPDWIDSLDVSADGRLAITACEDGTVRLWSLAEARVLAEINENNFDVNSASLAPNGAAALLASANDFQVRLWRLGDTPARNTELLLDFDELGGVLWSAQFSPDGAKLVTIGGNDARLWDLASGEQAVRFSPHGAVAAATLSDDGKFLVTGSWDNSAKIWDADTGRAVRRLDGGHLGYINSAEFSPDGSQVLTASDDGSARLWDFATGKPTDTVFRGHTARVVQAVFSPDGTRVLTTSGDKTARIWDRNTGEQLSVLQGHEWAVLCGQFAANGRMVVTGSEDNTAIVWDARTGKKVRTLAGHTSAVTSVAISPDGQRVLTGSQDNTAKLWDPVAGKEILSLTGHDEEVTAVAFSPNGQLALTGSRDGTAIVWLATDWRKAAALARSGR